MKKITFILSLSAIAALTVSVAYNAVLYSQLKTERLRKVVRTPEAKEKKTVSPVKERVSSEFFLKRAQSNQWEPRSIRLEFSCDAGIPVPSESGFLTVTPSVPFRVSPEYNAWVLNGDFEPEKGYEFTLKKGLRAENGEELRQDAVFRVKMLPLRPSAEFLSSGLLFPRKQKEWTLPLELTNVSKLSVTLLKIYENNIAIFSTEYGNFLENAREIVRKEIAVKVPRNRTVNYALDLENLIPDRKPGVYAVRIDVPGAEGNVSRVLAVTDLAIQTADDPLNRKAFVAVRSFETGAAEAGAAVTLVSRKNQILARGVTNAEGIVILDYSSTLDDPKDSARTVTARKGDDLSYYSDIGEKSHSLAEFGVAEQSFSREPRAFLYTGRGVYRAGETVHASVFIRDSLLKVYPDAPCVMVLRDAKGTRILSRKLKTDASGFASTTFTIPEDGLSGNYTVLCSLDDFAERPWGSSSILVADFVPDRIKTALKPSVPSVRGNDGIGFELSADYYFGQNAGEAPYSFQVTAVPAPRPVHWSSWSVGDREAFAAGRTFSGNGCLANGRATLTYPGFSEHGGMAFEPVLLVASAQVREPGGRAVSATVSVPCDPFPCYLGIRKAEKNEFPKEAVIEWKLLPAEKDGAFPKKSRELQLKVFRLRWDYVLKKDASGQLGRVWELAKEALPLDRTLRTGDVEGVFRLPLEDGQYEVELSCCALRTRMTFFHWAGEGGVRSGNPSVLSFRTDKELYRPGETARVTFASPFEGFAFVSTGERTLETMQSFPVKAGENTLSVRLPGSVETASCFSGITVVGKTQRSFGLLRFRMDRSAHLLKVSLSAPDKAFPGEKIRVGIDLSTPDGKPCEGLVQLFAADEGILALTGYRTPDIFSFFFGDYACGFQFSDVYGILYPELRIDKNGKIGGDGSAAACEEVARKLRRDCRLELPKSAVVMLPAVRVNGKTTLEMSLPDHLGAMRLMAVASAPDRSGSADRTILLRDRIGVMASGPIAVAPGDEAELTFSLFNYEMPDGPALFKATPPDSKTETFSVQLKKNTAGIFRMRVKAPVKCGVLAVPYELTMGNVTRKGELRMTVRPQNPPVRSSEFRVLRPGESWKLPDAVSANFQPGSEIELTVSPSPASVLKDALEWLNSYPYGCLEQTTAAAFPFIAADTLSGLNVIPEGMARTAGVKKNAAAAKILSMMLYNGSFSAWPGGTDGWNGASIFAAHFLNESGKWENDPERRCRAWLRRIADTQTLPRYERAYACYVLSGMEDGQSVLKEIRNLLAGRENDFAAFLASAALIKAGYAGEGNLHLNRVLEKEVWRTDSGASPLADEASRAGMALYLLMDLLPESPAALKLASLLQQKVRPDGSGWGTTHSNAWASLGLAAFAKHYGAGEGSATVSFGPSDVSASEPGKTLSLTGLEKKAAGGVAENRSASPVYVRWSIRGVPREIRAHEGAIRLKRQYLDRNGREVKSVSQGELVTVRIRIGASGAIRDLAVVDLLPGGLEIEDERFATRMTAPAQKTDGGPLRVGHVEKRGDRIQLFGDLLSSGTAEFTYQARAVTRGRFAVPPLCAEAMYSPGTDGIFPGGDVFEVK